MDILARNLEAMEGYSAEAARAVTAAVLPADFLRVKGSDGAETFLRRSGEELEWLGGTSMPGASAAALTGSLAAGTGNGLGLSMGSGYEWGAFLRRLGGAQALFVYEPEAGLAKMALSVCDLSEDLASGRLVMLTGSAEEAAGELRRFLAEHLGYEAPGVLHPLATILAERRNGLLAAGEFIVRQAIEARHAVVSRLAGDVREQVGDFPGSTEAAMLVTERYGGERPLHALVSSEAPSAPRLVVDRHATCSIAGRLEFLIRHRPGRILSDLFRSELGCIPGHIAVHTYIPPLAGAGFWQPGRLPGAGTISPGDRIIVHAEVHRILLEGHGVGKSQIELLPLRLPAAAGDWPVRRFGDSPSRIVMIGNLPRTDAASLGLELPTHQAVHAAAAEIVAGEYLTVSFQSAGDILRRALRKAGVGVAGATSDPALGEPMLRMVRDVLIPSLPVLTLARALVDQKVAFELVGDWPGLERGASGRLRLRSLAEFCGAGDRWEGVAAVVHLSPWGTVSPVLLEGVGRGVPVVAVRHVSDGFEGSLAKLLPASGDFLRPEGLQIFAAVKGAMK